MFKKVYTSLVPDVSLENPNEDYKSAKRCGQYKLSDKALYKPDGGYIPFSAIKEFIHDQNSVHVAGCCAGGVPVERIIFVADNIRIPLIFDTRKQVEEIINKNSKN